MMMNKRIQPWRWSVKILQAVLILGIPFLTFGGESALRFDVPSLTLHFFGSRIGMDEFFFVLVAVLFLGFLITLLTILFGRIWCGWLCPQTVIMDLSRVAVRKGRRGGMSRAVSYGSILIISLLVAANLLWYVISPYEFFSILASGHPGQILVWSWTILTVILFLNIAFLRHGFCSTVCPYAKMQGALYDGRTLVIGPDPDRMVECLHCEACVEVCPVGIDVRGGLSTECINCAECIDACAGKMENRRRPSLIGYRFGSGDGGPGMARRGVQLTALSTGTFLLLLIYLLVVRQPLDIAVSSDPAVQPHLTVDGQPVNAYVLSLTNRSDTDMQVTLTAEIEGAAVRVAPDHAVVPQHGHIRLKIAVVDGSAKDRAHAERKLLLKAVLVPPHEGTSLLDAVFLSPW